MVCDLQDETATQLPPHDTQEPADALPRIAACVEQRVGRQRFDVWFAKSTRLRLDAGGDLGGHRGEGGRLTVVVPNDFVADWVRKHFGRDLSEAAGDVLGCSVETVFEVDAGVFERGGEEPSLFAPVVSRPRPQAAPAGVLKQATARVVGGGELSPLPVPPARPSVEVGPSPAAAGRLRRLRHELDDFIVGPHNELAHDCCRHVAATPGGAYNPLFVHGGVGLGKTHLLQGLCRAYARRHPTGRWAYLTGEEFTNDFIQSVRTNRVDNFRRRMRDLDLLVIDDVHFLGGKRATQEEFLHTFNAVEAAGRHVVIASDAHPKTIAAFGDSLINRFVSGMVVRVDPPARESRTEVLKVLAERQGLTLTPDATDWIAARVTQNVRELEGAVTRMAAHVRLGRRVPDAALAAEVLGDLDRLMSRPVHAEQIFEAVREFFGLERSELMSGRRQRTISLARSVAMYLARKLTNLSYPEIAGRMGKRNHSTVISACRRVEASVRRDDPMTWTGPTGDRTVPASDLVQRLEEQSRARGA